jgi:two-component system, sensor histidine kinase RegB
MDNSATMAGLSRIDSRHESPVSLRRLVALRWWLLVAAAAAIWLVPRLLDIALPVWPMLLVVALQALANGLAARRLAGSPDAGESELLVQLTIDVVALGVLMFLSGGAANPLISLLLLPVAVAALTLPARRVAAVALLAILAYSLVNVYYLPLPIADAQRAARLHLAGMWLTFVVSVVMVAWLVVRMTDAIRRRDAELAAVREQALRDERVVALGALAAGAAHELSTPLATMAIIASELEGDPSLDAEVRGDLALLRRQVAACKGIISGLAERAGAERLDSAAGVEAVAWLKAVFGRWRGLRPHAAAELDLSGVPPGLTFVADATLEQGLLNLFNNAANAGSHVRVAAARDDDWLRVEVRDDGPGFPAHVVEQAGKAPFPAYAGGSGIGLFLAHAAIARLGGRLTLGNDGGGVAQVRLPLNMKT